MDSERIEAETDFDRQPYGLALLRNDYVKSPYMDKIAIEILGSNEDGFDFLHPVYGRKFFRWCDVTPAIAVHLKTDCTNLRDHTDYDFSVACVPDGLHARRLKHNEREKILFDAWRDANKYDDMLRSLLHQSCDRNDPDRVGSHWGTESWYKEPLGPPTERDRVVAATVIQWLGSNVGMQVIDALVQKSEYFRRLRERS